MTPAERQRLSLIIVICAIAAVLVIIFVPKGASDTPNNGGNANASVTIAYGRDTAGTYVDLATGNTATGIERDAAHSGYDVLFSRVTEPEITANIGEVKIERDDVLLSRIGALALANVTATPDVRCSSVEYDTDIDTITLKSLGPDGAFDPQTVICVKMRNNKHATIVFTGDISSIRIDR